MPQVSLSRCFITCLPVRETHIPLSTYVKVARLTGLEPATPGVTGRYSNQLSYNRVERDLGEHRDGVNGEISGGPEKFHSGKSCR